MTVSQNKKLRAEWQRLYCPDTPDLVKISEDYASDYYTSRRQRVGKRRAQVRMKIKQQLTRTRELGMVWDWSEEDGMHMLKYWKERCAYCGAKLSPSWAIEHYIPLSVSSSPGTVSWNLLPACQWCNSSKCNKMPRDWISATFGEKALTIIGRIEAYLAIKAGGRG